MKSSPLPARAHLRAVPGPLLRALCSALLALALLVPQAAPAAGLELVSGEQPGRVEYAYFPAGRTHLARPPVGAVVSWDRNTGLAEARLLLDGAEVARWTSGSAFVWRPSRDLARGRHDVVLEVTLQGHSPLRIQWSFQRVDPPSRPAARDVTDDVLPAVNRFRAAAGLPPMSAADGLARAAVHHAAYLAARRDIRGLDAHTEQPGHPGFTGATVGERAYAFGWTGYRPNEGVVLSSRALDPAAALQNLIDTVYHRIPFQVAGATDLGAGLQDGRFVVMVGQPAGGAASPGGPEASTAAAPGGPAGPLPAVDITVYPADGQVGIPLDWDGVEAPDPYRLFPGARPGGYPITAVLGCSRVYHCYDAVTVTAARLYRDSGGSLVQVPAHVLTPDNDPYLRTPPAVALLPVDRLQPGTRYTVEISLRVRIHGGSEQSLTRRWSFTTTRGQADRPVRASYIRIEVDGRPLDLASAPYLADDRVLVPFRDLAEALDADVAWDETTQTVTMRRAGTSGVTEVVVRIDNDIARINGTVSRLDAAPRIIDGRTYVPLRFVAEALDVAVHWYADRHLVQVRTGG